VAAFGLAAGAVAGVLRLPWLDMGVAAVNGLMIGALMELSVVRPRMKEAAEAVAAMLAAAVTVLV